MKVPTVYNMTRYNTDDLILLVNKAYMFKSLMTGQEDNEMKVIHFREHGKVGNTQLYNYVAKKPETVPLYVGHSVWARRHQVKLIKPELLHASEVEMLVKGAQEQLFLSPDGVKALFFHVLSGLEHFSLHGIRGSAATEVANQLTVRFSLGKKPKAAKEVLEYDRAVAISAALKDVQYSARCTIWKLRVMNNALTKYYRRVRKAKGEANPETLNRYLTLKGELDQLLTDIYKGTI
jgi:hypothetical protein